MTTPYASPTSKNVRTVEVAVEYLCALRKAVGLQIDPDTAEVEWTYAHIPNPYGDDPNLQEEYQCVGRAYFARSAKSEVWICFNDLPDATRYRGLEDDWLGSNNAMARVRAVQLLEGIE